MLESYKHLSASVVSIPPSLIMKNARNEHEARTRNPSFFFCIEYLQVVMNVEGICSSSLQSSPP